MFLYEQPEPEVVEKLRRELGMTPESIKRDVACLKDWLSRQPHLPDITDDRVFETFLTHCKNSMERTKQKLDAYYTERASVPEFYQDRDPEDPIIKASTEAVMCCPLPKTTPEGDRVTIMKLFDNDLSKYNAVASLKAAVMLLDANMCYDLCRRHILVYDVGGTTMGHIGALTPILKSFITSALAALPQRYSGFHVLNAPTIFETLVTLAKSVVPDKLAKRIHVHSKDLSALHKFVPQDILPEEYGGTYNKTLEELRALAYKSMLVHREWYLKEEKLRADESKRLIKKDSNFDHPALDGSFRKIAID